ncbi:MAG: M61 family peptidase [Candidatus Eremiobacteraeota bacterium]|nr:M61 family peptidase [Candidatus Eremiobacteraeota bacterium]
MRCFLFSAVLCIAAAGGFAAPAVAASGFDQTPVSMTLAVDASDATRYLIHVHETLSAKPGPMTIAYPKWVPGEHGAHGPLQNIATLAISSSGHPLTWTRDLAELHNLHITVPPGADSIDIRFDYLGSPGGTYSEARLATSTILTINWNQYLFYPANADIRAVTVKPSVILPGRAWIAQTALPDPVRTGDTIAFAPATLERLVDSPLDAGTVFKKLLLYDKDGVSFEIDIFADRPEDLEIPAKTVTAFKNLVPEMLAIYTYRHWNHYHALLTVSDVMPGNGVEHTSSSDDGDGADYLTNPKTFVGGADLLVHEFNHSWDGKYRRPFGLATWNFQVPEETNLLWVYEGMTQFYGDLVSFRTGLRPAKNYPDFLAGVYASLDHEPGRATRPLIDTASSAPFLYDAPRTYSSQRRTAGDFYSEGELLWLDVDATLHHLSGNKRSLDGFATIFFGVKNTLPTVNTYTYEQLVSALDAYQPYDWNAYFQRHVYSVSLHPPSPFEALGWRLTYTDKPNSWEKLTGNRRGFLDLRYTLGLRGGKTGDITDVLYGTPAANAGMGIGDKIIAVNGFEFDADVLNDAITAAKTSHKPIALLIEHTKRFRTVNLDYHGGLRYPHLVRITGTPDLLSAIVAPHRKR